MEDGNQNMNLQEEDYREEDEDDGAEVSFSNRNASAKVRRFDKEDSEEEMNPDGLKSMMKFAEFLEKRGYIRQ